MTRPGDREAVPPRPPWMKGSTASPDSGVEVREALEIVEWGESVSGTPVVPPHGPSLSDSVTPTERPSRAEQAIAASSSDALELAEFLPTDSVGDIPPFPHPLRHPLRATAWVTRLLFGIVSLVLLLALIAAIPIVNFLALGYLLETEGRLARTGRLRFMFPLLDLAPRLGSIVLGMSLWLKPLQMLADAADDALLIDPDGGSARTLRVLLKVISGFVAIHLCLALARGGSLGCFFRPIKNVRWLWQRWNERNYWETAEQGVRKFVAGLRLPHHFWLGLRGFVGAAIWLWPPTLFFAALRRTDHPGQILSTLLGGAVLILVFAWVPFLQARMAAENRFGAMFELRPVRELFRRAPLAWLIAVVLIYALSLPLYLFKIVSPPQDALWLETPVFILSIYPARVLTGWAYHRAWAKPHRAWFGFRWVCRTVMLPLIAAYVFLLFFTPFISEHGKAVLFEHPAFLLPVPF